MVLFFLFSCKKEKLLTDGDAYIYFSADTLKFDTVFTTTGSITRSFKVFNPNEGSIRFSSIRLMGGNASSFRININGLQTFSQQDVELEAGDSMYVFVTVNAQPQSTNLPFLINDSIEFAWNGNQSFVQLKAFGQNAYFLRGKKITSDTTWNNALPIVLLDSLIVTENATLTITEGTKIYVHAQTPFIVKGTLNLQGRKNEEVTFQGDRLDEYYRDLPGSWNGLTFTERSQNNTLKFAVIKNAINGIEAKEKNLPSLLTPVLTLKQCIIDNASACGILCTKTSLMADNCLISNCGQNVQINKGGQAKFINCTMVAYSTDFQLHQQPGLFLSNAQWENNAWATYDLQALFQNCIIWGDGGMSNDEVELQKESGALFEVNLENCLYRAESVLTDAIFTDCIQNQAPSFDTLDFNTNRFDFRTNNDPLSPNIDMGKTPATPADKDLDDLPRVAGLKIDIGCYERQ